MIHLLVGLARSHLLGLDIGGEHARVMLFRNDGKMNIVSSKEEERIFPSKFTIIPKNVSIPNIINASDVSNFEFVFNDQNALRNYPNSSIRYWKTLFAKIATHDLLALIESRHLWGSVSTYYDSRVLISGVLPELAFYHTMKEVNKSVKQIIQEKVESLFIVVPRFFPQPERDTLRTIAKKNGYKPYIVDSTTAVGYYYALEFASHYQKQKKNVLFFDFGSTNVEMYVISFSKVNGTIKIEEEHYEFDDTTGGRDIDIIVTEMLEAQYKGERTPRVEQILLQEAEKIKHRLTTDQYVVGTIDNIDGENDFTYNLSRKDFEKELEPLLGKLRFTTNAFKGIHIDRIQVMGGSCRIPAIQVFLQNEFGIKNIAYSMQQEETLSKAACFFGAAKSQGFSLPPIEYEGLEIYEAFTRDETKKTIRLESNLKLPTKNGLIWIQSTGDHYPIGSSTYLVWTKVNRWTQLRKTPDGLFRFERVRGKVIRVWRDLLLSTAPIVEYQQEQQIILNNAVNALEDLVISVRTALADSGDLYATARELSLIEKATNQTDIWFNAQREFKYDSVKKHYDSLAGFVSSFMARYQTAVGAEAAWENLTAAFDTVESAMDKWSRKGKKPHRADIRSLLRTIATTKVYLKELKHKQKVLTTYDDPILSYHAIDEKANTLLWMLHRVEEPPKPKSSSSSTKEQIYTKNTKLHVN